MRPTILHGHDRIRLWLDQPEYPGDLDSLRPHCRDVQITSGQMPYNARWKAAIDLFQPTRECLDLLQITLGARVAVQLEYVEIAIDLVFPLSHSQLIRKLRRAFMAAAVPQYHRREAVLEKGTTWYFERRSRPDGRKRPHVLAVYADRPSKLNNRTVTTGDPACLHIEWRASGVDSLMKLGLATLADLAKFDHAKFWPQHVFLYGLPSKTVLGRILAKAAGKDQSVSGTALRRRAERWQNKHSVPPAPTKGQFVLHNALRGEPALKRILPRITFKDWLSDTLKNSQTVR